MEIPAVCVRLDGRFIVRFIFPVSLGAPSGQGSSSSFFCLCILHTQCQTFIRCSEPVKAEGMCWEQYKPRVERGWLCGVRLCWELKVNGVYIINYIKLRFCPLICLLLYHIKMAIIKTWRVYLKLFDLKSRQFRIVEISFGGNGRNLKETGGKCPE